MLMRTGVLAVTMLVLCAIGIDAAHNAKSEAASPSLAGQLLVATPELDDPNFRHAVVYMVQHDASGALGVVVNRVLGAGPLDKLLQALGIEESTDSNTMIKVHYGGPVRLEQPFVLHSPDYRRDGALVVDDLAAFSFSPDALRDMAHGQGPRRTLFGFGYAGWGADQLESEIARGSWFTIAPDEALLFDQASDTDAKWRLALARRGVDL